MKITKHALFSRYTSNIFVIMSSHSALDVDKREETYEDGSILVFAITCFKNNLL